MNSLKDHDTYGMVPFCSFLAFERMAAVKESVELDQEKDWADLTGKRQIDWSMSRKDLVEQSQIMSGSKTSSAVDR